MANSKYLQDVGKPIICVETYIVCRDKVLMHKRALNKSFPGWWIGPGGHIDENEDALSAAIRKVKEETDVNIAPKDIALKVIAFHYHEDRNELYLNHLFLAHLNRHQKKIKVTEEGISAWIPIKKLLAMKNVFPPSFCYLKHILDEKSGILYARSNWENARLVKEFSRQIDKNG